VLKFGGAKALTKHLYDEALKAPISFEETKVDIVPKIVDNSLVISVPHVARKPRNKMNVGMAKSKMPSKRVSRLDKATQQLYNLEELHGPEKSLNIGFGLYQMEDY